MKFNIIFIISFLALCFADEHKINFDPQSEFSKEHLKEDLSGVISKTPDEMTAEEMQFHYFREHDFDNDKMLDGNEIARKLIKRLERLPTDNNNGVDAHRSWTENEALVMNAVDEALTKFDTNGDGMIGIHEYKGHL